MGSLLWADHSVVQIRVGSLSVGEQTEARQQDHRSNLISRLTVRSSSVGHRQELVNKITSRAQSRGSQVGARLQGHRS
ncbi:UNVERIFIED_CONTAM: hypothetical protein Slati_2638500 [Sesamum latifolium]|uniref:Uncharacterized protein n=1 Tax=Sesamum latifolium TaxID=2727402 RepID=A0AAW2VUR3_9LAMI